ncbi:MAG: methionyl-tRNA formyltransferase [Gammaproteobacteria bacterium]|nr:methionyl-tRNA formyltransferase [Gammaproteobacteria bacterium]MCP4091749.1 methionyl-tRNA formyltransferase [Gammaproteobacteria bacterium]MCP4275056.1 methionyl-tRNA formyltransferase [Gammaproteobacteria bacterium]MCP4831880.1 methionyl-tRNA formyltransferase [Gammaproteobacteria bacterium]MCP4929815.1 methionyl-tRNA formyltransferase [Gammaproteobacteria bacterium]
MQKQARIIFAGSPDFSVPVLQALLASSHKVVAVLTQPDRPAGRGRKCTPSPVKSAATEAGLPVLQPETLNDTSVQQELVRLKPDLMVVVAYGLLLPTEVLQLPKYGCINLHASLLPRWRGASPMQAAILAGDTQTGVGIMQMDEGLDTGSVFVSESLPIAPEETIVTLHDRLAELGAGLLSKYLDAILAGELQASSQPEEGIRYAGRISKSDGLIDWSKSAIEIDRQIRAYQGWPVAHTLFNGELLRCLEANVIQTDFSAKQQDVSPGALLQLEEQGLYVQAGEGVLSLSRLQLAGRKPVTAREFANAQTIDNIVLGF